MYMIIFPKFQVELQSYSVKNTPLLIRTPYTKVYFRIYMYDQKCVVFLFILSLYFAGPNDPQYLKPVKIDLFSNLNSPFKSKSTSMFIIGVKYVYITL